MKSKKIGVKKDSLYHNTEILLKKYRDINYDIKLKKKETESRIYNEYNMDIDTFLESTYQAGINFENTNIESVLRSLKRSNDMLKMLEQAIIFIRENHRAGEIYYWIVYYSFLSTHESSDFESLLEVISKYIPYISSYIYYSKRKEAIRLISDYLWGYTSTQSIGVLLEILSEISS